MFSKISLSKLILMLIILFSIGTVLGIAVFLFKNPKLIQPSAASSALQINAIAISADAKSILNSETKAVIFTIADTQKYFKDSGYFYNPDTFQTTNAKYEGDCFTSAALSNKKDRIVFSTGCLSGDLPQAWIGEALTYNGTSKIPPEDKFCKIPLLSQLLFCSKINSEKVRLDLYRVQMAAIQSSIHFLIGGSGRNFVWSADDKTITYEADLGLSGMTETRTINSGTGEILEKKSSPIISYSSVPSSSNTENSRVYRNEKYGFQLEIGNGRETYIKDAKTFVSGISNGEDATYNSEKILIVGFTEKFTLTHYLDYSKNTNYNNPSTAIKKYELDKIPVTVDGINTILYIAKTPVKEAISCMNGDPGCFFSYFPIEMKVKKDNNIFEFSGYLRDTGYRYNHQENNDGYIDLFKQIIFTFKFLEKDANGWIVVRNEKDGYMFSYPPGFLDDVNLEVRTKDAGNENFAGKCPGDPDLSKIIKDYGGELPPDIINGQKLIIGTSTYCKYVDIEGAAGYDDADYKYTDIQNNKLYTLNFVTTFPGHYHCSRYENEASLADCKKFNEEVPKIIDKVVSTFKFIK